jgi:hypothetical protein
MPVLHTLICRSYILLYAGPTYSYMPVRNTLICRSYVLLYAGPIYMYSYMPVLYTCTLICRSYIHVLLYASPLCSDQLFIHTLICHSCILLCAVPINSKYVSPLYSYLPVLYTLICPCYILLYANPVYSEIPALYTVICRFYDQIKTGVCSVMWS